MTLSLDPGGLINVVIDKLTSINPNDSREAVKKLGTIEAEDGRILLWDVTTGEVLEELTGHTRVVESLAFSRDGDYLASGSCHWLDSEQCQGELFLWDLNVESWKARACRRANRNLTASEWNKFIGPGMPYHSTCPDFERR